MKAPAIPSRTPPRTLRPPAPPPARIHSSSCLGALMLALAAIFWALPLTAAVSTNNLEFANLLPALGSDQWATNQRLSAQHQDQYRKRVAIAGALATTVPRAPSAQLINGPAAPPPPPAPARHDFNNPNFLCFTAIVLLAAGFLTRKYAPEILAGFDPRHSPWPNSLPARHGSPNDARPDENPFGEFLAAFRAGPAHPPTDDTDADAAQPHAEFYPRAKTHLATQRKLLADLRRTTADAARKRFLVDLYFEFGMLKDEAAFPDVLPVWRVAFALEGLLKEHVGKIRITTPSTLRTIENGLDLLDQLCLPNLNSNILTERPFKFLIVDDELISRHALSLSLKKAFSEPDVAVDGPSALEHTTRQAYDVIFLDVQMPGMDGFELCQKIHESDPNRATPVVFVTHHSDFEARATSMLVGGHDLMAKPFLIFEITAKALTLALQGRLQGHQASPTAPPEEVSPAEPFVAPVSPAPRLAATFDFPRRSSRGPLPSSATNDATELFLLRIVEQLGPLYELCQALPQAADSASRQNLLTDAFLRVNSFAANAPALTHPAFRLGNALEGLLRKLLQDANRTTPSALATIASAVDLLNDLCAPGLDAALAADQPFRLLVVDDDLTVRRALVGALQTVFEKPASAGDGETAFALARRDPFDVIFLDLQMPGMGGFETCSKIRETSCNRETPIVFVTARSDFAARAESVRSGGNELVEKPFLTAEINVKALTFALSNRLQQRVLAAAI